MQARIILAVLAVILCVCFIGSSFSSMSLLSIIAPILIVALGVLFCAIGCGWRCGIYIFMVVCVGGVCYSSWFIFDTVSNKKVFSNMFNLVWNVLQLTFEVCVALSFQLSSQSTIRTGCKPRP
mmetsp:Transcript_72084/g.192670  ORF Transcript_72084/g.192670 Transcript_72084/m.192670 type:complete len:123 (+) Transcript_72084:40-408(+)